jgi:chemotaxis methyl-accepting protein methylase
MNKPSQSTHRSPETDKPVLKETVFPAAETISELRCPFPVVAVGASAGGLEALEAFLSHVPADSGMAIVIVQHLDPTHKGMLVELLQRRTAMPVAQVTDRMRIEPNSVYVIPPNKDMSILHGVLHLLDPIAPRGLRLPIDFFFRSLADDQQENSVGVILSGMGSDGTLGLRAIAGRAGATFVQDPASAKFDGMPGSAIGAGLADVVAPVEELPGKIFAYLQHAPLIAKAEPRDHPAAVSALEKVVILLRAQTGNDFSLYRRTTLYRRIERRMGLHQISKIANYVRFLQENPQEVELLFRELLIGVTRFFRDTEAWEQLKAEALPALLAGRASDPPLRAWVPACATGEEAYSLAIIFKEALEELDPLLHVHLQIFATDLDQHAIEKAREAVFPANIAADVSAQRLDRFFTKVERGYRVTKSIREMVVFAAQNIIMDPPFTKLDLLSCRNLLIYLTPELQKKLLHLLHYSLNPGGFLFLGNAETVGDSSSLFAPLSGEARLYRRLDSALAPETGGISAAFGAIRSRAPAKPAGPAPNLQALADQLLLQAYSPAAALTTDKGDILYISGHTGKYLEPAAGKANLNIFAMAREGLRVELTAAFQKAVRKRETLTLSHATVAADGAAQAVTITVQPISDPDALSGMVMVVFCDVAAGPESANAGKPRRASARLTELGQELEDARQEAQSVREEMQTSQEELTSTNEELQSINEELQSTNEELTTSKEELQSMNEELYTVNQELQLRLDELARTNSDMKNLLDSTDIATLFLDDNLCVRRFTSETSRIIKLIPGDVGRPITDIASALLYPELADDAHEVLRTLVKVARQLPAPDGSWFEARILPYRTLDNVIDGVVVTFVDITVSKKLESDLRATEARLREMLDGCGEEGRP